MKLPQSVRLVIFTDLAETVATRRAATIKNFISFFSRLGKLQRELICRELVRIMKYHDRPFIPLF
jgi:hypothetical protein